MTHKWKKKQKDENYAIYGHADKRRIHIRVPRCRKPFGQPLWELHGISQNRCFFTSAPPFHPLTLVTQQSSDSKSPHRKTSRNVFFEKSVNDVFLTLRTDKKSDNLCLLDSSLREREQMNFIPNESLWKTGSKDDWPFERRNLAIELWNVPDLLGIIGLFRG